MRKFLPTTQQTPFLLLLFACLTSLVSSLLFSFAARAEEAPLWGPEAASFAVKVENENYDPPSNAGEYCEDQDFTLSAIHGDYTGIFRDYYYADKTYTQCAFTATYGTVGEHNILQFNNNKAYHVEAFGTPVQVPNTDSYFVEDYSLYAYDNPLASFELQDAFYYERQYRLRPDAERRVLRDSSGEMVQTDEVDASPNGEWLIVDLGEGNRLLRVDSETFELLAFPGGVGKYNMFSDPNVDMAISNDGRYAALSGGYGVTFKLYDLSTCVPDSDYNLNEATGCDPKESRITEQYLGEKLGGRVTSVSYLQFNDDGTQLSATVGIEYPSGEWERKLITLTAPGHAAPKLDYLALGDSFSSGEGDMEGEIYYLPGTDGEVDPDEKCHLSKRSYPYLIAKHLNFNTDGQERQFASVACSGADSYDIDGVDEGKNIKLENYPGSFDQLEKLEDIQLKSIRKQAVKDFTPGRAAQIEFVKKYKPKAITLTIGGNDLGFADKLKACLMPQTCRQTVKRNRAAFGREIAAQYGELKALYVELHEASPKTKIYVLGYPQFISDAGACQPNVQLNFDERKYVRESVKYMNSIIAAAANDAGVTYVDIEDSLQGIALCDLEIGLEDGLGVNGVVVGDDQFYLPVLDRHIVGNESYHPNAVGHEAIAAAFRGQISNPLDYDTCPETTDVVCPSSSKTDVPVPKYFQHEGIFEKAQRYLDFAVEKVRDAGSGISDRVIGSFKVSLTNLRPVSTVRFELWSEPVDLGTFTVDTNGELARDLTVPDTVKPGYHTLRAHVTTGSGEEKVFYETILITGPENDIDGDGIANEQDRCSFVETVNADQDRDGVDDACDAAIDQPPLPEQPTVAIKGRVNTSNQKQITISGQGTPGTIAHISIDDTNPDTSPVTGKASLEASSTKTTTSYAKDFDVSSLDDGTLAVTVKLSNNAGSGPTAIASMTKDTHLPETEAIINPAPNEAGWQSEDVAVTLNTSDQGAGIKSLTYYASGAQPIRQKEVVADSISIPINTEGKTIITYFATDKAGNIETKQTITVRVDKTAPKISVIRPKPRILFGFFGDKLTGKTIDSLSGAASTDVTFTSHARKIEKTFTATCASDCKNSNTTWQIAPTSLPTGLYKVTATSTDIAGNKSKISKPVRVVVINLPWFWRW